MPFQGFGVIQQHCIIYPIACINEQAFFRSSTCIFIENVHYILLKIKITKNNRQKINLKFHKIHKNPLKANQQIDFGQKTLILREFVCFYLFYSTMVCDSTVTFEPTGPEFESRDEAPPFHPARNGSLNLFKHIEGIQTDLIYWQYPTLSLVWDLFTFIALTYCYGLSVDFRIIPK